MNALKRCIDFTHELGTSTARIMSCKRETILFGGGAAEQWVVANGVWDKLKALLKLARCEDVKLVSRWFLHGVEKQHRPLARPYAGKCNAWHGNQPAQRLGKIRPALLN